MSLETKMRSELNFAEIDYNSVAEFLEQTQRSDKYPYSQIRDKSLIGEYLRAGGGEWLSWGGMFGLINAVKNVPLVLLCEAAFALSQRIQYGANQDLKFEDYVNAFGFSILGLYLYNLATSVLKSYVCHRSIVQDFRAYLSSKKETIIS